MKTWGWSAVSFRNNPQTRTPSFLCLYSVSSCFYQFHHYSPHSQLFSLLCPHPPPPTTPGLSFGTECLAYLLIQQNIKFLHSCGNEIFISLKKSHLPV